MCLSAWKCVVVSSPGEVLGAQALILEATSSPVETISKQACAHVGY